MTHSAVATLRAMARKPNKAKPGTLVRLQIVLPGELVDKVDAYAKHITKPLRRPETRTDAFKELLIDALTRKGFFKEE
jgi:hypothetical protein